MPVAAALAMVAGLLQFASGPAVAADSDDMPSITLPGEHRVVPRRVNLAAVDDSGYLAVDTANSGGSPATWTGRDGSTREFRSLGRTYAYNGGLGLERAAGTTNLYEIRRYATNKVTRVYVPAGDRPTRIFAENRLVTARKVGDKWTLRLLEVPAGGGKLIDRPVTGVADDFSGTLYEEASDTRGAAFWYKQANGDSPWRTALFDFATASVTYVPSDDFGVLEYPHLAGDTVLFYAIDKAWQNSRLYVIDRSRPQAPGHLIDLPRSVLLKARAIGDWLMYPDEADKNAIRAVPVTGGPERTLLRASSGDFVDGDDGSFSIAGGTDAEHWSVQHVALGPDGVPAFEPVAPLPAVSVYEAGGIAVDQGRVLLGTERANAPEPYSGTDLTGTDISQAADGTLTAAPRENMGSLGYQVSDPDHTYWENCYGGCLRFTGTGEGTLPPPEDGVSGRVLAASGPYLVITQGQGKLQVRDGGKVLATGSWPAADIWGDTLWVATAPQGATVYERYSLPSMRKLESVSIASCLPTDLQVVNQYLYWSCGPNGEAGVYDLGRQIQQEVPQGYARLGDGYLVSQDDDAGKLLITYLKGAVPADRAGTEELGPLPSPSFAPADLRGRFWNVDRFGGPVAYQTASGDVTVKWPQVTTSPLTATYSTVPTFIDLRQGGFGGTWHLNRPTTGWKLTVTTLGGAVVRTVTGGPAHGKLTASWDGRAENGTLVRAGDYRVSLTARAANGATTDTPIFDGLLTVRSLERHDFGRDGIGDLVTFDSAGRLAIQPGTGRGTIDTAHKALAGGWPTSSTFVPFGDLSGDACNDLLVRDSAGRLTRYDGTCGKAFTPKTPPHSVLGTGFGAYDVLTSPGDLTGDGRADLVARDRAGVLWRYSADGKGGLEAPVKLVAGQGGYTRLVGAGDLNADGIGDMVGLDRAGVLWRWFGNGKGAFGARVRIAGGISVTALAVPGDLTGDGRPDLVGRDSAGALWRWNGTSAATFGAKTRIATGWNAYTGLY
ncbi:FG-GAP-like repeat-containing protein [Streptomyces sp. WI04-05B]|uniref:FG-GAP-like repeat-containing protein n=1 Tax=Streptomyces TaxID=1883 RepID=UPI0029A3C65E|nr:MULTISPECIES: FG-GAP-like repeat-containing protein [unclassified Streptomyces]MDX2542798.1 FG-GAP-like repeat-containing protein [Streptomyces sp. WI04-05B]MDX2588342.1 FG-GAP-like repeat-containing protein [Streptomyces sp. WI04-05A]